MDTTREAEIVTPPLRRVSSDIRSPLITLISSVVKFRRTGESARSEDEAVCGEHEVRIEGVRRDLEPMELAGGTAVPKEVVKFRRTGESARSEDEAVCGEHEVRIEGVRRDLEPVELAGGTAVPKEFANPTDDTFLVEDAVEAIGFGKFQWKLSILTGLAWMADAMEMMILSILAPQLHWPEGQCVVDSVLWSAQCVRSGVRLDSVSKRTGGNWDRRRPTVVFWALGTVFEVLLAIMVMPTLGWRWLLLLSTLPLMIFSVLCFRRCDTLWLHIALAVIAPSVVRIFNEKMLQTANIYVSTVDFSIAKNLAKRIKYSSPQVFWALGTVFEVLLAIMVMPMLGWRWLLLLSTLPLMIFSVLCFWLPESARYDVLTGNQEKALATLKRIAKENGVPMPLGKLTVARQEDRGKIRDLFSPQFRWTTVLLWFIWFSNAFSYYGLVLLTTELFQAGDVCSVSKGRRTMEPRCSLECKYLTENDYKDLLWTTLSEFPGVLVTLWVIDRIGRKKTMALSFIIFSLCILLLLACVGRTALTVFLFIARAFISGGFQAAYVYTPEVYPTATRALGLGTCSGMARVGALLTPFIAQVMLESSVYLTLSVYCCCSILAAIASCALPIETTGRGLQESSHRQWGQEMVGRASHSSERIPRSSSGSQN
ncbi:UNVERIFIED_CONTAM: hypothetical protein FKN15_014938 [Acipenser sinensis]